MNTKARYAFVVVLLTLFCTSLFIYEPSALAALWKYRDARGGVHFVNEKSAIPQRFRHTAIPVEPKNNNQNRSGSNSSGSVRVAPGAALGAVPTQSAPVHQAKPVHVPTPQPVAEETYEGDEGRAMLREQIKGIQSVNPFADAQVSDQGQGPLAYVAKLMSNPRTVKLGQSLGSAQVLAALESIMTNPNKYYGMGAVAVLLFIIGFLKWRLTTDRNVGFIKGVFIKLIFTVIFIFGSVVISYVVYGEPLVVVYNAIKKGFEL